MQNLKIYKKSPVMRNISLFAIFSMFYLHVIESFVKGVTTFSLESYISFFNDHKFLFVTLFIFCFTLFEGRKFSKYFYLFYIFQCIYLAFSQYMIALDKFVLILNFFFLILSYYFFLFVDSDLEEASNTPISQGEDIYTGLSVKNEVQIVQGENKLSAHFVNWDDSTCFLKTRGDIKKLRGQVRLEWEFEDNSYSCRGDVVSGAPGLGVGIRLTGKDADDSFGWVEFYDIIKARGYSPNLTA